MKLLKNKTDTIELILINGEKFTVHILIFVIFMRCMHIAFHYNYMYYMQYLLISLAMVYLLCIVFKIFIIALFYDRNHC